MHPSKVTLRPKVRRPMAWDSTKSAPSAQQPEPSTQCPVPGGYRRAETRHHRIASRPAARGRAATRHDRRDPPSPAVDLQSSSENEQKISSNAPRRTIAPTSMQLVSADRALRMTDWEATLLRRCYARPQAMSLAIKQDDRPLTTTTDGVVVVTGTRVSLDLIIAAFTSGATAEEIAQQYPTVALADVY